MGKLSLSMYPAEGLFVLLKQYYDKLEKFDCKKETASIKIARKEINSSIAIIKNVLINRFKDSEMPLRKMANKILSGEDYEIDVYKSLFLARVLSNRSEIIDTTLLKKVIDELDVDSLHEIIENKKGTIYSDLANDRYQNMMFEVEKDVEEALHVKTLEDIRLNEEEDLLQEKREKANKFHHIESPYTEKDTITIQCYLNNYIALTVTDSELTHNDLKHFQNHCIIEIPNDYANEHQELVTKKYILLVLDKAKHRRSYVNPQCLDKILDLSISKKELNDYCKHIRVDLNKIKEYIEGYQPILNETKEIEKLHNFLAPRLKNKKVLVKERDEINEKY